MEEPALISAWKWTEGIDGTVGPRLSHHLESLSWYRLQATGPASGTQTPSTHVCPCQARNPQTYLSGGNRESCTTELGEMPKG